MGDWAWRDGHWRHDPDLPTPVTPSDYDPSATRVDIPAVTPAGRLDYQGAVDWAWPPDQDDCDTGDMIDPNAPDPTPDEITDPGHPDHVDPWTPA